MPTVRPSHARPVGLYACVACCRETGNFTLNFTSEQARVKKECVCVCVCVCLLLHMRYALVYLRSGHQLP
jgi:hypothetical protein